MIETNLDSLKFESQGLYFQEISSMLLQAAVLCLDLNLKESDVVALRAGG